MWKIPRRCVACVHIISGLRRNLTDVLFAAKPKDLPSALCKKGRQQEKTPQSSNAQVLCARNAHFNRQQRFSVLMSILLNHIVQTHPS